MKNLMLLAVAAFALAACTKKTENAPAKDAAAAGKTEGETISKSIKAPTPADVAVRIGAADEGKTIKVAVGSKFAVELVGVPTAGYVWDASVVPAFLTRAGDFSGPTSTDQLQPGFAGGNHWEVLVFAANAAGKGELRLQQKQPWAPAEEPPADEFSVTIDAQ